MPSRSQAPPDPKLVDQVKKLLGKPPYNSPANYLYSDGYFQKSLEGEFGEIAVQAEITRQLREDR